MTSEQPKAEKSKMANLLQKVKGGKSASSVNGQTAPPNGRNWIHAPENLINRHVAYLVKFLGTTHVDQPKGIEVVKEAIRRLQFNQQLKKAETKNEGKCKKVEITISVDGVAIQEPRSNNILHQFPLHKISYCADDKGAKKYFSFIAKGPTIHGQESHECFVFISTKLASDITLTIGQAFDLAYRRFLSDNGKYIETQKLSLEVRKLTMQANTYKSRLQDLARIMYKDDLKSYLNEKHIHEITEFKCPQDLENQIAAISDNSVNGTNVSDSGLDTTTNSSNNTTDMDSDLLLATPPSHHNGRPLPQLPSDKMQPYVGTKLEGLLLNSDSDDDFDPRACEATTPQQRAPVPNPPLLAPPPKSTKRQNGNQSTTNQLSNPLAQQNDPFGASPFVYAPQTNGVHGLNGQNAFNGQNAAMNGQVAAMNNLNTAMNGQNGFNGNQFVNGFTSNGFGQQPSPNYNISDLELETSVFNTSNTFDPFDTQKSNAHNIFNNNNNGFAEKQQVVLDSSFTGFLEKSISEMKDGFSRGISFGNGDFSTPYEQFKKN